MRWAEWEQAEAGGYWNARRQISISCDGIDVDGRVRGVPFTIPLDVLITLLATRGIQVVEAPPPTESITRPASCSRYGADLDVEGGLD